MEPSLHRLQTLLVVGEAVGQADVGEQQHLEGDNREFGGVREDLGGQGGSGGPLRVTTQRTCLSLGMLYILVRDSMISEGLSEIWGGAGQRN